MTKNESKYVRTVMKVDEEYKPARINTLTGEIREFTYRQPPKLIKARPAASCGDAAPHWLGCVQDVVTPRKGLEIRSSKTVENPYFGLLNQYDMYTVRSGGIGQTVSACEELSEDQMDDAITSLADHMPIIDDYFSGVAHLDDANPLSKNVMFHLLRSLPEISSNTIYQATSYSERYCQRLATALRIFIKLTT